MSKLKVDFDVFAATARVYDEEIKSFESAKKGVETALDELKSSGWVSNAGSAWFEAVDMSWGENIDYHIRVISELAKELGIASKEYQEIYDKQSRLKNHLI